MHPSSRPLCHLFPWIDSDQFVPTPDEHTSVVPIALTPSIAYTFLVISESQTTATPFKLLSAYTGMNSMDEVLRCPRAVRFLWLEILINDRLELEPWQHLPPVQAAFAKACRWYTTYRTVLNATLSRTPLPHDPGPIDFRDYRTFAEVLRFVTAHS